MKQLTLSELKKKIKALGKIDAATRNSIICSLVGHSHISTMCFGYRYCARCGDQVGDSLGSIDMGVKEAVIVGHNCPECKKNFEACTIFDKIFVRNPFSKNYEKSKFLETI